MSDSKPQGFAIQLYFDSTTEKQIFAFRESVYQLGITPVLGKMGDRPHVTFAVFGQEDAENLKRIAHDFSLGMRSFAVELAAIGVFPTSDNVVYLTPVPSFELIKTHSAFHRVLKREKLKPSKYYLPDRWVPHCTLEFEQPDDQYYRGVELFKKNFSPIRGQFFELGVVAFRPIEYLAEYPLPLQE
jgi:2'-5' RNA ligase